METLEFILIFFHCKYSGLGFSKFYKEMSNVFQIQQPELCMLNLHASSTKPLDAVIFASPAAESQIDKLLKIICQKIKTVVIRSALVTLICT